MNKRLIVLLISFFFQSIFTAQSQSWFTTNQNADLMISGVDFNNTGGALYFNHPSGLATDGSRLLVCDRFNNRVLLWNSAPLNWNDSPDLVIGQTNFSNNYPGISKSELNWPGNASLASNGVLSIADTENDRILIWTSITASNGQAADVSLHLPTMNSNWRWPWGVWTDGIRLAAVATQGGIILFWDSIPLTDNRFPDYTISLPQFGTPRNISTDGSTYFFVGDHNAKVNGSPGTFFWNSYPTVTNQPYDFFRNDWIKGTHLPGGELIAAGLQTIYTWDSIPQDSIQQPDTLKPSFYKNGDGPDVVFASNRIYINNYNGNNILVYDTLPSAGYPDADFAIGVSDYYHNTLDSIGYIQNGVLASDGTKLIVTSDFDRKMYIYHSLPVASGIFPDTVLPTPFPAWDNALFNDTFVIAGMQQVAYWNSLSQITGAPSQLFNGNIGTAAFTTIKGVALDSQFFYLADQNGVIYIWSGIPASQSVNPLYTINLTGDQLNRITSDGVYLCVTRTNPPSAVYIYKVNDIAQGILTPWKTINIPGMLNMAAEALAFNGSLAIANQANHNVLLWEDINNAGDTSLVTVLGQPDLFSHQPANTNNGLFMPASLLSISNNLWVAEFKFSSRILRYSYSASGTTENNFNGNVFCYPNPFGFHTTISFPESSAIDRLFIYDNLGKEVFPEIIRHRNSFDVNFNGLAKGVYFYRLLTKEGVIASGKMIVVQ